MKTIAISKCRSGVSAKGSIKMRRILEKGNEVTLLLFTQ